MDDEQRREAQWLVNGWRYLLEHPDESERWLDPWLDRLAAYATTYGMEAEIEDLAVVLDSSVADLERRALERGDRPGAFLPSRTTWLDSRVGDRARPKWPGST